MPTENVLKNIVPYWRQIYFKWKSLRNIPLRKRFFIGYDLDGNTYWEMKNHNNPYQMRRILFPRQAKDHLSDYNPPPQWLQWLRHTRSDAPDLKELMDDKNRQYVIKLKAAEADRKWKQVPLKESEQDLGKMDQSKSTKETDKPKTRQPVKMKL